MIYTQELMKKVIELKLSGVKESDIEKRLNINKQSIYYICRVKNDIKVPREIKRKNNIAYLNIEYCQKMALERYGGKFLSTEYITNKEKYWWECNKGHKFFKKFGDVSHGSWCPYCSGFYNNSKELAVELATKKNGKFLSESYNGQYKKYLWECEKGHQWLANFKGVKNGRWCPECSGHGKLTSEKLLSLANKRGFSVIFDKVGFVKDKYTWKCSNNHEWAATYSDIKTKNSGCPSCSKKISQGHLEIIDYLKQLQINFKINDRKILSPLELDVSAPEYNLGIEYNGLYWHSESGPSFKTNSHYLKYKACQEKGIKLLAIFEDEWKNKQELIKAMIRWRLGKFNGENLNARDLELRRLDKNIQFESFFNRNHLDGHSMASYAHGLFKDNKLVCCVSIRKNFNKELEICRLATDYDFNVRGGAGRLISAIKKELNGPLISFSNNRVGNGSIYKNLGFSLIQENGPSYWYTDGEVRIWRFKCKRINDPEILSKYPTEKSQAAGGVFSRMYLGKNVPMYRIEDYGHKKWILE